MKTREEIIEVYNRLYESYFRKLDDVSDSVSGERYTEIHKWRIIKDISLLPELSQKSRVLEIGPSIASVIIKELTGAHVETICIDDLNRDFLDKFNIPLHLCDLTREEPPVTGSSWDLILFCEVLEHFTLSPKTALKRVLSLLDDNGVVFFSVPNFASATKRFSLLTGKNPQDTLSDKVSYYAHIREPVFEEARNWWENAGGVVYNPGFTNYDEKEPGGFLSQLYWTLRFIKIRNGTGLLHIWFPRTRRFFYFFVRKDTSYNPE